jgi:hypothetical protein
MSWTRVSKVVSSLKKQLGLDGVFFTVGKVWDKEVGIEDVEIIGYKNGTIFVQTGSSVASYDITVRKKEIIRKLNQYMDGKRIKDIKINIK